jgi:hypothetical protein
VVVEVFVEMLVLIVVAIVTVLVDEARVVTVLEVVVVEVVVVVAVRTDEVVTVVIGVDGDVVVSFTLRTYSSIWSHPSLAKTCMIVIDTQSYGVSTRLVICLQVCGEGGMLTSISMNVTRSLESKHFMISFVVALDL